MSDLSKLPTFGDDGEVHVIVETPKGSGVKLKYDDKLQVFTIARPLALGVAYPFDWGFVPSTEAEDGDPLDAMVLYDGSTFPGFLLKCRPLGVVKVTQKKSKGGGRERNDRVIFVPVAYPRCEHLKSVRDLPKATRDELQKFFEIAVVFADKDLHQLGWGSVAEAKALIKKSAR